MQPTQGHGRTHYIVLVEAAFGCILSTNNSGTHFNLHCVMVVVVVVAVVMVVHVHMHIQFLCLYVCVNAGNELACTVWWLYWCKW